MPNTIISPIKQLGKVSPTELSQLKDWLKFIEPIMIKSVSTYAQGRKELHLRHFVKLAGKDAKKLGDEVIKIPDSVAKSYKSELIESIGERLLPGFHEGLVLHYPKGTLIKPHRDSRAYDKGAASVNIIGNATFFISENQDAANMQSYQLGEGDCIQFDNKQPHAIAKVEQDRWCVCFFYLKQEFLPKPSEQLGLFLTVQTTENNCPDSKTPQLSNCLDKQQATVQIVKPSNLLGLDGFPFTKPRYKWADAPSWWNPMGEEIEEDCGEFVRLAYHGRLIPKSELIQIDPVAVAQKYNTVLNGQAVKNSSLLSA